MMRKPNLKVVETGPAIVPSLAEVSPEYGRLQAKRSELEARKVELGRERSALEKRHYLDQDRSTAAANRAVAALLGDPVEGAPEVDDRERLRQIATMLRDVERALETLEERINAERRAASKLVCDQVKDEYDRRVTALCEAVTAMHERHVELVEMTNQLDRRNVQWSRLHPMQHPRLLGSPTDTYGPVAQYLREAIEHGFLGKDSMPESLRHKADRPMAAA